MDQGLHARQVARVVKPGVVIVVRADRALVAVATTRGLARASSAVTAAWPRKRPWAARRLAGQPRGRGRRPGLAATGLGTALRRHSSPFAAGSAPIVACWRHSMRAHGRNAPDGTTLVDLVHWTASIDPCAPGAAGDATRVAKGANLIRRMVSHQRPGPEPESLAAGRGPATPRIRSGRPGNISR
jgi:hypothetical protein